MHLSIPNRAHRIQFWFNVRKALFQVILPAVLLTISFFSFTQHTGTDSKSAWHYVYAYTWGLLLIYAIAKYTLEFIFSTCADDVMFRKKIDLERTTSELEFADGDIDSHQVIVIRKIYKLRYSGIIFFAWITKVCWYMGIDSPILIPLSVVTELNPQADLTQMDNESYMHSTLANIRSYRPTVFEVSPIIDLELSSSVNVFDPAYEPKRAIPKVAKAICDMKSEIFNEPTSLEDVTAPV